MHESSFQPSPRLARHDGEALYAAPEAILKGLLETETPVSLVAVPRTPSWAPLLDVARDDAVAELLRKHDVSVRPTPTAARAVTLAAFAARAGGNAMAFVPNDELAVAGDAITRAAEARSREAGSVRLLLEERPATSPESPLHLARALDLPTVAPADLGELRDMVVTAPRLARAAGRTTALLVHASLLQSAETIAARPNRVIESVDAMLARRRGGRRPRVPESADVLRLVRRLELNRVDGLPSPGERTPVGFITVGPADRALAHLVQVLRVAGRVPVLQLGALHPVDDAAVSRLLARCAEVVVLEPRPGAVEGAVLALAESMRHRGERPAAVSGRELPPDEAGVRHRLGPDDALHPSRLARRILGLLHLIRPSGRFGSLLAPPPPPAAIAPPPRGASVGPGAALALVRRIAGDVDQWLRERGAETAEDDVPETALAIDGAAPAATAQRIVPVETWDARRFLREGIGAVRQAAREDQPWLFIVCTAGGGDGPDLARLARGVVPDEGADRVRIETANLADRDDLVERLREAALAERMTIVIVGDGPPAVCDVAAIERALAEIDGLGFEPRQRVRWPVDRTCAVRPVDEDQVPRGQAELEVPPMRSQGRLDRLPTHGGAPLQVRVRPLSEQVEVLRTRPPARRWRRDPASPLPLPEIVHRRASRWRAHVAGFASDPPGLAARILGDAGRRMGYAVSTLYDPQPIGAGRRAWAQVLFTRPREGEARPRLAVRTPAGEADLLVGLDVAETVRALTSDPFLRVADPGRTHAVVNHGLLPDERDTPARRELDQQLRGLLRETTQPPTRIAEDFVGACRAWFHTDRVASVTLIGAAYQSGLVPVTIDAIEAAVSVAETSGHGRLAEAFQLGRHLAVDPRLFSRPRDDREEDVERIVRRIVHLLGRERRGAVRAGRFGGLVERSLRAMPGLAETDAGRQARRDVVLALYRCSHWGGIDYAERYAALLTDLYRADRGDSGRALTRNAVLPLAATMLVRDPIFIASMATSGEHRRRIRQTLNVKRAREDELQRRYLTRFEALALGWRLRADVRSSDWLARILSTVRPFVPQGWRGTRRERDLRAYVVGLVERATRGAGEEYERYQNALMRLHEQAVDDRLHGMALSEARMIAEPAAEEGSRPQAARAVDESVVVDLAGGGGDGASRTSAASRPRPRT